MTESNSTGSNTGSVVVHVFGRTDVGRTREHNEDAFVVADLTRGNATLQPEVRTHVVGDRGSLFMVAGKRYAELQLSERTGAKIRKSLESYTGTYLRFVWTLSATAMVVCYSLWAFERDGANASWYAVTIVPITIAMLRYAVDVDGGLAGEPEEIALKDRVLQLLFLAWIGTIGAAVFLS